MKWFKKKININLIKKKILIITTKIRILFNKIILMNYKYKLIKTAKLIKIIINLIN